MNRTRGLAAGLLSLLLLLRLTAAEPAVFERVEQHFRTLAEISGLRPKRAVPRELITRQKVNAFLQQRVKEVAKPEDIRVEALTLRKLGFIPRDFDLAKSTVDLLTEQAAAFYDFRKKRLFLLDSNAFEMQDTALVHELAHALADQYFNLDRFIKSSGKSDDRALAHLAVMEGQANWLMFESIARQRGETLIGHPERVAAMNQASESGAGQYPVFASVPLYLRRTLVFPYTAGLSFQQAVTEKMGKAGFAEVFRNSPQTTQQVMHPEMYFARAAATGPALPEKPRGMKKVSEGMIGELDLDILLEQYAGAETAKRLAPHWRGGRYAVFEDKAKKNARLLFAVDFDGAASAREFFGLYRSVLEKKPPGLTVTAVTDVTLSGMGQEGEIQVTLDGTTVRSTE